MHVGVYSLQKVLYQGDVESVNCQTAAGEITILDHHRPLISILRKGVMKIIDQEKKEHYIPVSSGFLEVRSGDEAKFLVLPLSASSRTPTALDKKNESDIIFNGSYL
jgi:ATP synthase F1 epsilon subunit